MKSRAVRCHDITGVNLSMRYTESDPASPINQYDSHTHMECEICIHLSGDVSFMVENHLYPVIPGSITITRPYEYHHCIYRSNAIHRHFCIFFTANKIEPLLNLFYDRELGENNLLTLPHDETERLIALCHDYIDRPGTAFEDCYRFFQLIHMLNHADIHQINTMIYPDILSALTYINLHLADKITVQTLAKQANVSVNTLERHFWEKLGMTPSEYMKQKRLAKAFELLAGPYNVTETCEKCGFNDCSAFIAQFRRVYGMTPLQYKKSLQ